mmetsp:Transcript_4092/g.11241  ORF Transcript_4092/g.11241 Transcript_4092/m.11241 type:complete len:359 (-) Transcript_4092:99-1175(-)|eukprot:CAMPEP_0185841858 /NCGR_PEP_ID=MMETSP1353-20130828/18112_1 /TAXON_ID=1077150 /ORGANISM="Erythrolobus australicus, Strain CCMP3124" /LENGTH=358 /DNA_ID=CAMNT_0028541349 /DNA_START=344 /DNA_END=1420 /DNA_ORIENTATION=+
MGLSSRSASWRSGGNTQDNPAERDDKDTKASDPSSRHMSADNQPKEEAASRRQGEGEHGMDGSGAGSRKSQWSSKISSARRKTPVSNQRRADDSTREPREEVAITIEYEAHIDAHLQRSSANSCGNTNSADSDAQNFQQASPLDEKLPVNGEAERECRKSGAQHVEIVQPVMPTSPPLPRRRFSVSARRINTSEPRNLQHVRPGSSKSMMSSSSRGTLSPTRSFLETDFSELSLRSTTISPAVSWMKVGSPSVSFSEYQEMNSVHDFEVTHVEFRRGRPRNESAKSAALLKRLKNRIRGSTAAGTTSILRTGASASSSSAPLAASLHIAAASSPPSAGKETAEPESSRAAVEPSSSVS